MLNGFEDTITLYGNTVFPDPLEPVIIHILRRLAKWCRER